MVAGSARLRRSPTASQPSSVRRTIPSSISLARSSSTKRGFPSAASLIRLRNPAGRSARPRRLSTSSSPSAAESASSRTVVALAFLRPTSVGTPAARRGRWRSGGSVRRESSRRCSRPGRAGWARPNGCRRGRGPAVGDGPAPRRTRGRPRRAPPGRAGRLSRARLRPPRRAVRYPARPARSAARPAPGRPQPSRRSPRPAARRPRRPASR